jgi:hypothetical protein
MSQGILVRETTNVVGVGGGFATRHWIVAVDDPQAAERAVRETVPTARLVEATNIRVSPETIEKLGLAPGQARPL